jgi:hypothetical protein
VNLDRLIYRPSIAFFTFIAVSTVFAFWPGYLSQMPGKDVLVHVHGALLTLWIAMLISQAALIRTGRRELHRQIGKLSYLLAPLVFISIATIRHNAMARADDPFAPNQLALLFPNAVIQPLTFALTYGMAIFSRKDAATHARFMLCTLIPAAGPIFNRVMASYVTDTIAWAPVTAIAVLVSLVGLSIWDWRSSRRLNVFPLILVWMVFWTVVSILISGSEFQIRFANWYLSLPLS